MGSIRVSEATDTARALAAIVGRRVRQVPPPQGLPPETICGGALSFATGCGRLDLIADAPTSRLSGESGWQRHLGSREVTQMGGGA